MQKRALGVTRVFSLWYIVEQEVSRPGEILLWCWFTVLIGYITDISNLVYYMYYQIQSEIWLSHILFVKNIYHHIYRKITSYQFPIPMELIAMQMQYHNFIYVWSFTQTRTWSNIMLWLRKRHKANRCLHNQASRIPIL